MHHEKEYELQGTVEELIAHGFVYRELEVELNARRENGADFVNEDGLHTISTADLEYIVNTLGTEYYDRARIKVAAQMREENEISVDDGRDGYDTAFSEYSPAQLSNILETQEQAIPDEGFDPTIVPDDVTEEYRQRYGIEDYSITAAKTLPEGWHWREWDDGGGGLYSPDGVQYGEYDRATDEYRYANSTWSAGIFDNFDKTVGEEKSEESANFVEVAAAAYMDGNAEGKAEMLKLAMDSNVPYRALRSMAARAGIDRQELTKMYGDFLKDQEKKGVQVSMIDRLEHGKDLSDSQSLNLPGKSRDEIGR